jgi:hypothetical protein
MEDAGLQKAFLLCTFCLKYVKIHLTYGHLVILGTIWLYTESERFVVSLVILFPSFWPVWKLLQRKECP